MDSAKVRFLGAIKFVLSLLLPLAMVRCSPDRQGVWDILWRIEFPVREITYANDVQLASSRSREIYILYSEWKEDVWGENVLKLELLLPEGKRELKGTFPHNVGLPYGFALAVDPKNRPAVLYYNRDTKWITYSYLDGSEWVGRPIEQSTDFDMNKDSSIGYIESGDPVVSYQIIDWDWKSHPRTNAVRVAIWRGNKWDIFTADIIPGEHDYGLSSVMVTSDSSPWVIYNEDLTSILTVWGGGYKRIIPDSPRMQGLRAVMGTEARGEYGEGVYVVVAGAWEIERKDSLPGPPFAIHMGVLGLPPWNYDPIDNIHHLHTGLSLAADNEGGYWLFYGSKEDNVLSVRAVYYTLRISSEQREHRETIARFTKKSSRIELVTDGMKLEAVGNVASAVTLSGEVYVAWTEGPGKITVAKRRKPSGS